MQVMIRDENGDECRSVECEMIGGTFGVHFDDYHKFWRVTHIASGMHINGDKGNFKTREQAVAHAEFMLQCPIIWFFSNREEMDKINDRETITGFYNASLIMLGIV